MTRRTRNVGLAILAVGYAVARLTDHGEYVLGGWALMLVATTGIAVFMWLRERRLNGALERIATANGWSFARKGRAGLAGLKGDPFDVGHDPKINGVVGGNVGGRAFSAFNYSARMSDDWRIRVRSYYSVVTLTDSVDLPAVEIRATLGGVEQALGLPRLEFENGEFNRRYRVGAADHKHAYDVLNPRALEAIIAGRIVNLRIGNGRIVAWAPGRLEVHEVLGWSRALVTVLDRIPDFVWKDHAPQGAVQPRFAPGGLTGAPPSSSLEPTFFPTQEPS